MLILSNWGNNENAMATRLPIAENTRNYLVVSIDSNGSNSRSIDNAKSSINTRVLSLNPHRCRLCDNQKMRMLKQAIEILSIDEILLNETKAKEDSRNIRKYH